MSLQPISGRPLDFTAWAKTPPTYGADGSVWERMIIELAEQGESRFVDILREHIASGVIRSDRAKTVFNAYALDAAA